MYTPESRQIRKTRDPREAEIHKVTLNKVLTGDSEWHSSVQPSAVQFRIER